MNRAKLPGLLFILAGATFFINGLLDANAGRTSRFAVGVALFAVGIALIGARSKRNKK